MAIVASSWHEQIMVGLVAGAMAACTRAGAVSATCSGSPGAFELPLAAQVAAAAGFDAVVALGVVDPRGHAALRLRLPTPPPTGCFAWRWTPASRSGSGC